MTAKDKSGGTPPRGLLSVRYICFYALLLIPFLSGGVVTGDEALLLSLVRGFDASTLSFGEYARSAAGWYIPHHILWFAILYATSHIAAFLHFNSLLTEAVISAETVAAALGGIILCYVFLLRRMKMTPARSAWTVLAFFAAGYGVFTFCLGGVVECYMFLVMSARLFLLEPQTDSDQARKLAIADAILICLKAYSVIFLVMTLPLLRTSHQARQTYFGWLGALMAALVAIKLWLWNPSPIYYAGLANISAAELLSHFLQQIFSPWTGLVFCLPILLVLFWVERARRRSLLFKAFGLAGCAAVFSLYDFFDGDIAGGRYIFPFLISLLPEIAGAISKLLDRDRRIAWLLPVGVLAFLPVTMLGFPFFPTGSIPDRGPCTPLHPAIYSWNIVMAKAVDKPEVEICFHDHRYVMSSRDVASPHLGLLRVGYLLEGGHSESYREAAHNAFQRQHDAQGERLVTLLKSLGLGSPGLWLAMGLTPSALLLLFSIIAAIKVNRRRAFPAPAIADNLS